MTQKWTYTDYDETRTTCTHQVGQLPAFTLEPERGRLERAVGIFGLVTAGLCLLVVVLIYLLYFL